MTSLQHAPLLCSWRVQQASHAWSLCVTWNSTVSWSDYGLHSAGRKPGCKRPVLPCGWDGGDDDDEAFLSLHGVCSFPLSYALPCTCELPSNTLSLSSLHQVRDAVSDPSAVRCPPRNTFLLFTSVKPPFPSASPDRNYGSRLFAHFQHGSDLELPGLLPGVLPGVSPSCGLPTHPEAHLPRPTSFCYTVIYQ